jgi:RNA polymerase sigma-70 factor, ECF subfamily
LVEENEGKQRDMASPILTKKYPFSGAGSGSPPRVLEGTDQNRDEDRLLPPAQPRPVTEFLFPKDGLCTDASDNDLLEAIAGGDRQAFAVLVRRHLAKMVALAQRIVFDSEQAREIAQEAFLRVWLNAAKWDPAGTATFLTWLRRVVINFAISQRRRRREQVDIDTVAEIPDPQADGFDHVATAHQKRIMKQAMQKLPERQRAALALFYFDDVSQIEAAVAMQLSPKAFDSLLVRARRNLKKYLAAMGFLQVGDLS